MTAEQRLRTDAEGARITCVQQVTEGERTYWKARITLHGTTFNVDRKYGSWMLVSPNGGRQHVLPAYAARLQDRVRTEERKAVIV